MCNLVLRAERHELEGNFTPIRCRSGKFHCVCTLITTSATSFMECFPRIGIYGANFLEAVVDTCCALFIHTDTIIDATGRSCNYGEGTENNSFRCSTLSGAPATGLTRSSDLKSKFTNTLSDTQTLKSWEIL